MRRGTGEIRHNNVFIGKLLDLLVERGLYDDTAIVVTAHHGEGLGEHGSEMGHGAFYQHTAGTPSLQTSALTAAEPIKHARAAPSRAPTLLELGGLPDPGLPGRSLLEVIEEGAALETRSIHIARYRAEEITRFTPS